jgi:hypothetical protein
MMDEDALKRHIKACPIGWHKGQLKLHRATTEADVIAWLLKLEGLADVPLETIETRLPRPLLR